MQLFIRACGGNLTIGELAAIICNADDGANGANGLRYCTAALKLFLRRAALSGASRLENLRVHRCFLA